MNPAGEVFTIQVQSEMPCRVLALMQYPQNQHRGIDPDQPVINRMAATVTTPDVLLDEAVIAAHSRVFGEQDEMVFQFLVIDFCLVGAELLDGIKI